MISDLERDNKTIEHDEKDCVLCRLNGWWHMRNVLKSLNERQKPEKKKRNSNNNKKLFELNRGDPNWNDFLISLRPLFFPITKKKKRKNRHHCDKMKIYKKGDEWIEQCIYFHLILHVRKQHHDMNHDTRW